MAQQEQSPISFLGLIIWLLAALFFLYEFFLRTFVGTVAHEIIPDLKLNAETFALIGSAYYITYALMQIPVGILSDKFGVKKIMVFATLLCSVATFLFAYSVGFTSAFISRLLMGFGSSFAFICLLVISVTWFPRKYFGFFAGASQFIGTMGPLLAGGPLVVLLAKAHGNWRLALSYVASFGIVLAILILLIVRTKPRDEKQTVIYLEPSKPLSFRIKRLMKNPQAWYVALYSAGVYISLALLGAIWGTEYLQTRGLSQAAAADMISIGWFGYAVGCPLLGAFSDIAKRRKPILIFCASVGIFVTLVITYVPITFGWIYSFLFFMLGIAGSGQNIGFAAISEHVDFSTRATALGLNNGAITLYAALIPPLASFFITLSAKTHSLPLQPHDFYLAFSLMPMFYILSLIISSFLIKETYCKPQKESIII